MIRTRFAPSPTGFLHIGSLKMALYNYLLAKQSGGKFLLRIEDTDQKRFVEGGIENILKSLEWAGIVPDEGVVSNGKGGFADRGDKGPYIQSQRLEIYIKHAQELLNSGHAYYCFCTHERLEKLREDQQRRGLQTGYDLHCRNLSEKEVNDNLKKNVPHVIRMKMPKEGETIFKDIIHGEVRIENKLVDDQVIIKADGYPTYHFAVVVDDHFMGITHVIRGEEWISSTPKHVQLYKFFDWETPAFAHLPLILNPDKSKLSKRQGDIAVEDYRKKGYLPDAMVNFVALLGWNPGTDKEIFSLDELVKEFSLEKVNKSGAVFDLDKLSWMNKQYIKTKTDEKLADLTWEIMNESEKSTFDKEQLKNAIRLERERVDTLSELPKALSFVFNLPDYPPPMLIWKKSNIDELKILLPKLLEYLNKISVQDWEKDVLERKIGEWAQEKGYSTGSALWPLRVALSGQEKSPGPFEIAEVLGKDEASRRLNIAYEKIAKL